MSTVHRWPGPSLRRRSLPSATPAAGYTVVGGSPMCPSLRRRSLPSATHPHDPDTDCDTSGPSLRRRSLPSATTTAQINEDAKRQVQVSDGDRFPLPQSDMVRQWKTARWSKSPTEIASLCHCRMGQTRVGSEKSPSLRRRSLPSATGGVGGW